MHLKNIIIIILLSIILIVILVSCNSNINQTDMQSPNAVKQSISPKSYSGYVIAAMQGCMSAESNIKDLKELESRSILIIAGTVTSNRQILFNKPDIKNGIHPQGVTATTIKTEKVFKGEDNIQAGDSLDIEEYYCTAFNEITSKWQLYTYDYYLPCQIGEKYVFFIKKADALDESETHVKYALVVLWMGKYLVNHTIRTTDLSKLKPEDLEINAEKNGEPSNYWSIFQEVKSKYFSEIIQ